MLNMDKASGEALSTTESPRIAALVHEWRVLRAKMELETLLNPGREDEAYDRYDPRILEIEKRLPTLEPETLDDVAGLLEVAIERLCQGTWVEVDCLEGRMIRAARQCIYSAALDQAVMERGLRKPAGGA